MKEYVSSETPKVSVTNAAGHVVAILRPLEYTDSFNISPFSKNTLENYPYSPVVLDTEGFEYSHCGCATEEHAMEIIHESCFGTDAVFLFLLHKETIKYGWYLQWLGTKS